MKRNRRAQVTLVTACGAMILAGPVWAGVQIDERLPEYESTGGVSGNITTIGSDTMNNLATLWGEGFIEQYPNVRIEVEGMGSSTGGVALTEGTASFAPMSREMTGEEVDRFEGEHGYPPTAIPVAVDMVAVYVHRDNSVEGMTIEEVDAIFSATQRGGHAPIESWGHFSDRGLGGSMADQSISLYGRNAACGTYGYFRENALLGGDYSDAVREQPGSSSVVQGVAGEINAVGSVGLAI